MKSFEEIKKSVLNDLKKRIEFLRDYDQKYPQYSESTKHSVNSVLRSIDNIDDYTKQTIARNARLLTKYGYHSTNPNTDDSALFYNCGISALGLNENDEVYKDLTVDYGINSSNFKEREAYEQDPILKKISDFYGLNLPSLEARNNCEMEVKREREANSKKDDERIKKKKNGEISADQLNMLYFQDRLKCNDKEEKLALMNNALGFDLDGAGAFGYTSPNDIKTHFDRQREEYTAIISVNEAKIEQSNTMRAL